MCRAALTGELCTGTGCCVSILSTTQGGDKAVTSGRLLCSRLPSKDSEVLLALGKEKNPQLCLLSLVFEQT